jgi:nitrite reductase/ring-hydroxylating ferredoxin subunit/uncharacterized membrane protein
MAGMKDILEGKPMRSPLHPALVHLPIALFPISVLLDVASWIFAERTGSNDLVRAAFGCVAAGLVSGLIAAVVGLVDYTDIRDDHPAKKTATLHMILNVIALGLFGAGLGLRYGQLDADRTATLPLLVSLAGLAVLSYSGYLGGHLVYADGIGVGRHRRRTPTPESTIVVPRSGKTESVPVADDAALAEGQTLRVEVGGVVMTVARVQGALHAFQEFCTHRYGPLSEGALRGCEIVCPWHNSRFDVRNGQVTAGPAKVPLKIFRVESRSGKIWVEVPPPPAALKKESGAR